MIDCIPGNTTMLLPVVEMNVVEEKDSLISHGKRKHQNVKKKIKKNTQKIEKERRINSIRKKSRKHMFLILGRHITMTSKSQPEPPLRKALKHMLGFQVVAYVHRTQQGMNMYLNLFSCLNHCLTG